MLDIKRLRFPLDIILVCMRWYAAYPLSYRHLEEMMQERGVIVDHSSIRAYPVVAPKVHSQGVSGLKVGRKLFWRADSRPYRHRAARIQHHCGT